MNILIIDDSCVFRQQLRADLEDAAFGVHEAEGGRAGLKVIERGARPNLILCDINMPDMDGLEFLAALNGLALDDKPPVFVLSAERSDIARDSARALGVLAWIVKPYKRDALIKAVNRLAG